MGRGRARAKQQKLGLVEVPDLRSLSVSEASQVASRVGLTVVAPDGEDAVLADMAGVVTAQLPGIGSMVRAGGKIMVWTSGPGGDAGVREPRIPYPPVSLNRAALRPDDTE